jgi:hypothetical protein
MHFPPFHFPRLRLLRLKRSTTLVLYNNTRLYSFYFSKMSSQQTSKLDPLLVWIDCEVPRLAFSPTTTTLSSCVNDEVNA